MKAERDRIILEHLCYIRKCALVYKRKFPSLDYNDLVSYLVLGCLQRAETYRQEKAASLKTWILGSIKFGCIDYIREQSIATRYCCDISKQLREFPDLSNQEQAQRLGLKVKTITEVRRQESYSIVDTDYIDHECSHTDEYLDYDIEKVKQLLSLLPEREQVTIEYIYMKEQEQARVAEKEGITPSAVSQIVKRVLKKLETMITSVGSFYETGNKKLCKECKTSGYEAYHKLSKKKTVVRCACNSSMYSV